MYLPKIYLPQSKEDRLLTLLLILLGVVGADGIDVFNEFQFNKNEKTSIELELESTQIRRHMLYNNLTGYHVQLLRKGRRGVNALGKRDSSFGKLIFDPVGPGQFTIQGETTHFYLCFKKSGKDNGKLVSKRKAKGKLCHFEDRYSVDGKFTELRSVHNKKWYVGFKRNGKAMKGLDKGNPKKDQSGFLFLKTGLQPVKSDCQTPLCRTFPMWKLIQDSKRKGKRKR